MRKLLLFMHSSLDGFVGGVNGEIDWIKVDAEIFDFTEGLVEQADTALYGRKTFQMMDAYWPTAGEKPDASKHDKQHSLWYKRVHKYVLSRSMKGKDTERTHIISENVAEQIQQLKTQPGKNILMLGSPSASYVLMEKNLIDEYWVFVNPIMLGAGIPLCKQLSHVIHLKLLETKVFSSGVLGLHFSSNK